MRTEKTTREQTTASGARPASSADLFWSFSALAMQGFGGVLAVAQRELVDRKKWLTMAEFVEDWAVAQILPGPNVVNLSLMIGDRYFGVRGALAALAGMLAFPLLVVLALAALFSGIADSPLAAAMLRAMGAVSAGLIGATGCRMIVALRHNCLGIVFSATIAFATFLAIALLHLPLIGVLAVLGMASCALAYARLRGSQDPA
jgi:chromate transporter